MDCGECFWCRDTPSHHVAQRGCSFHGGKLGGASGLDTQFALWRGLFMFRYSPKSYCGVDCGVRAYVRRVSRLCLLGADVIHDLVLTLA